MTVENGVIQQLSVSQTESFDPTQKGGCPRKWFFNVVLGLKPDVQTTSQSDGDKGHGLFANYFTTGQLPPKRAKLSKAVTGAITKGDLPKPGADLLVELRFDGQQKYNAAGEWIPLDKKETFSLGGIPWEGFIDLAYRRGPIPTVLDHKFSSDIHTYAKPADGLIKTVQMPVYALSQLPYWPDADRFELAHNNVARTGVDSFIRRAVVTRDQLFERRAEIEHVVKDMTVVAQVTDQKDAPHNRKSCDMWGGCAHQSVCRAFKEKTLVPYTKEEAALFAELDDVVVETAPETPPAVAAAEPKKRRLNIVDADAPKTPATTPETCACSAVMTPENASRLQSGVWKHIGCPLEATAPVTPPDVPASKPELASEQPAAPKEKSKKAAAPKTEPVTPPKQITAGAVIDAMPAAALSGTRGEAVADVLESIARLLRAA